MGHCFERDFWCECICGIVALYLLLCVQSNFLMVTLVEFVKVTSSYVDIYSSSKQKVQAMKM